MNRLFVKICGISTPDAAAAVADAGADAVGFVFAPCSPRFVTPDRARALAQALPPQIETVGVFRNQPLDEVLDTARRAGVATVQLHGDEGDADFDRLRAEGFGTIRAISVEDYRRRSRAGKLRADDRLLIDAVEPGAGATFDPALLEGTALPESWILAGGLTPVNVAELVRELQPGGVDVSSGVEASRGVKDVARIREFIAAARSV
ncbi:phosphoribosylanthranilate isomerase [Salinibacterium sp. PAMC 21357]|uniref:phosphoribosylanthranilate isomerase n=1 Tax=Salinibacterium sp. PAMC 21357 TaxID=1112215 RepID=UPI00028966CA|nr:phosphoribosylanthranilate isomerase [Salinibacterium sp. PAMC 21357]